jgi:hypothetical protein
MLLDHGADPSADDSCALLAALRNGREDVVALLEARGTNKPALEKLNDALIEVREHSYRSRSESAVQMLLDRGADANATGSESCSNSETSSIA